jgi:hypothetical protein
MENVGSSLPCRAEEKRWDREDLGAGEYGMDSCFSFKLERWVLIGGFVASSWSWSCLGKGVGDGGWGWFCLRSWGRRH